MLPTKEATIYDKWLLFDLNVIINSAGIEEHLYIVSDTAEIKEGDWFVSPLGNVFQHCNGYTPEDITSHETGICRKVIATTDPKLWGGDNPEVRISQHIPKISDSFIQEYIKAYNAGTPITEVMVEMENSGYFEVKGDITKGMATFPKILTPKLDSSGCIICSTIQERTFTLKDMEAAYKHGLHVGAFGTNPAAQDNYWIHWLNKHYPKA